MKLNLRRRRAAIRWIERDAALTQDPVLARLCLAEVVLDVGSGIYPQTLFEPVVHICVEPFLPYLERLRERVGPNPRYVLLNASWEAAMEILTPDSVDAVVALDFIEHLEKEDGARFLAEAERVARKQVVIFTPLGFYPQSHPPGLPDRWGMGGGAWQAHRSGWLPEDFDHRWEIIACADFHLVDQHEAPLERPFGAFWAINDVGASGHRGRGAMHESEGPDTLRRPRRRFRGKGKP